MDEFNKEAVGKLIAARRKEKEMTQKDLAISLFVSDKAVSKWERGLSMPDVTLLLPLADILGLSVTELLEGRKIEWSNEQDSQKADEIVEKAVNIGAAKTDEDSERKRLVRIVFALTTLCAVLEMIGMVILGLYKGGTSVWMGAICVSNFELLSLLLGVYVFFFMKEVLPAKYDQEKKRFFIDEGFMGLRLETGGIRFHNGHWPYIVRALRGFCVLSLLITPLVGYIVILTNIKGVGMLVVMMASLFIYLAGLFLPICIVGKKYE